MKSKRGNPRLLSLIPALGLMAAVAFGSSPVAASTLVVNDDPTGNAFETAPCNLPPSFTTIQNGLDLANAGDTVWVCPGTYYEDLQIEKNGLTLSALNEKPEIFGQGTQWGVVDISGVGATLNGFDISSPDYTQWGVRLLEGADRSTVRNNQVHHNNQGGIVLMSDNKEVRGNLETNSNGGHGIFVDAMGAGNQIYDNLANFNASDGIYLAGDGNTVFNNTADENSSSGIGVRCG